jgi:hypothetical protein
MNKTYLIGLVSIKVTLACAFREKLHDNNIKSIVIGDYDK